MLNAAPLLLLVVAAGVCEASADKYIDLGHAVDENSMYWVTSKPYTREIVHRGYDESGQYW